MTPFDKICAVVSIPVGAAFILLGSFGLFFGSNAHFDLPAILGFLPFFLGWTMCVTSIKYWKSSIRNQSEPSVVVDNYVAPRLSRFGEFLECHPEYKSSDITTQMRLFKLWLAGQNLS
ncbi:hypothetical protein HW115_19110 [Verrucomicrobiaceae bacterium N1E253]|uniref:Uncharacterized protein n=1 Tax=Oceaniferula marina TaxID=2748318 RepID=A0A851GK71_9BACT|nr:hypothetical protein [Oceaniferula marina]NWK57736.1 hypothetical protein [Oceaniferula marina]